MRSVIVVPTYNEGENIEPFLRAVRKAAPTTDVLVVDDNSPDGTGGDRRDRSVPNSAGSRCCTEPRKQGLGERVPGRLLAWCWTADRTTWSSRWMPTSRTTLSS